MVWQDYLIFYKLIIQMNNPRKREQGKAFLIVSLRKIGNGSSGSFVKVTQLGLFVLVEFWWDFNIIVVYCTCENE